MNEFQDKLQIAKKKIQVADHMLTQTYPMLKDPKLLLAVAENISSGMETAMDSLLNFERTYKRIPPFPNNFSSKHMALVALGRKMDIPTKYGLRMRELKEIIEQHKKSPVEFSRQGEFIIADSDYNLKKITVQDLKLCIEEAEQFNAIVEKRITHD